MLSLVKKNKRVNNNGAISKNISTLYLKSLTPY